MSGALKAGMQYKSAKEGGVADLQKAITRANTQSDIWGTQHKTQMVGAGLNVAGMGVDVYSDYLEKQRQAKELDILKSLAGGRAWEALSSIK
jgi:hypothetical protein